MCPYAYMLASLCLHTCVHMLTNLCPHACWKEELTKTRKRKATIKEEEDDNEVEDEGEDKDHICPYAHMIVSLCFIRVSLCLNACVLMLL